MLKQVFKDKNGNLAFEIECINPICRVYNTITSEFYFNLKKDFHQEYTPKINNKMPLEMNIIFDSMERCGISWIIRSLSMYHEKMFGVPIKFTKDNAEISVQIATKERFDLPKGFNNVYGVDPQLLLDKKDPT